jgi:D-glycero-alpha-D-manno-heptose-7-phosphate kinase
VLIREYLEKKLRGMYISSIEIERNKLAEPGGMQDQFHAAVGGFRMYEFSSNSVTFSDRILNEESRRYLSESLVLIATGGGRDSSVHALRTSQNIGSNSYNDYLNRLSNLTLETYREISACGDPKEALYALAEGMNIGWMLKKEISTHLNSEVDELIQFGLENGALAGKLCGAGGSGFAAFLIEPDKKNLFLTNFDESQIVDVAMIETGQELLLK